MITIYVSNYEIIFELCSLSLSLSIRQKYRKCDLLNELSGIFYECPASPLSFCDLISHKSSGFYISAIIILGNRELYFPSFRCEERMPRHSFPSWCRGNRRVSRGPIKRYSALQESSAVVCSLHGKQARAKNSPSFLFINSPSLVYAI